MGLPLEILLTIAEFAAWEECWDNKPWVAGLMRVSRAFAPVVRPMLYHCITVDSNSYIRLVHAVHAGVSGFAQTRKIVVLVCSMDLGPPDSDTDTILADGFGHVQYIAGYAYAILAFLRRRATTEMPRAVYLIATPDPSWFIQPDNTMQQCTHLHVHLDPLLWELGGRLSPATLREVSALTHLALDIAYNGMTVATIYYQFSPYLPRGVQRFLFRVSWGRQAPEFGQELADLASERQDSRLWLDEGTSTTNVDNLRLGLELWQLGYQLFKPPRAIM